MENGKDKGIFLNGKFIEKDKIRFTKISGVELQAKESKKVDEKISIANDNLNRVLID